MVTLLVTELVVTPRLAVVAVTELLLPTGVLFRLALGAMIRLVIPAASVKQSKRKGQYTSTMYQYRPCYMLFNT